jgi:hypothetical protein
MHGLLKQPGYRLYPPNNPEARDLLAEGLGPADLERAPLDQGPRTARPRAQGQHGAVRPGRYAAGRGPGRRHRLSARKLELIPARLVLCLLAAAASRPGGVLSFCLHSGLSADRQEQLMDQAHKRMPQREPDMLLHGAERRTPGPRACHSLSTTLKDRPQRLGSGRMHRVTEITGVDASIHRWDVEAAQVGRHGALELRSIGRAWSR